ncbi:D-glyceraldehyde dehydrogenase [Caldiplasma sukawensis]
MKNFIDGQWVDSSNGETLDDLNPSTGQIYDKFPASTKEDASRAIDAALDAFEAWNRLGSKERSAIIRRAGELIEKNRSELEKILLEECGKVKPQAKEEVDGVLDQIFYYCGFERKLTGDVVEGSNSDRIIFQYREPYGVVLALTPWNFPAGMVARKLAPALITGNTVVLKPSSDTPKTAEWIVKKFIEAGIPKGVLNLITGKGSEIGDYLVSHKNVALVTMTGSTETGQRIMEKSSSNMAKLILELGGKAPFMIWKDADLERAAKSLMWAKFWNAGQSCIASERLYVHEEIYEKFMKIWTKLVAEMKTGNPENSQMGPLINKGAVTNMNRYVEIAKKENLKIIMGGKVPEMEKPFSSGFFYEPTIIEDVPQNSPIFQEEIFGPIIGTQKVNNFDEMLERANDSKYGLASYLFTSNVTNALKAAQRIRFGELYINMPGPEASQGYHTGFRLTGQAGEGSNYGISEYLKIKNIYFDHSSGEINIPSMKL